MFSVLKTLTLFLFFSPLLATPPQIAIVGAGLAGLTTAYRLQEEGWNVEVYEARHRAGGRVFTVQVCSHLGELGAQNIYDGGEALHFLNLAEDLGLAVEGRTSLLQFYYLDGNELIDINCVLKNRGFTPEQLHHALTYLKERSRNMEEVLATFFGKEDLLYRACRVFLSGYEGAPMECLSSRYVETLYHFLLGGLSAVHPYEEDEHFSHLWIKGGNSVLTEKLANELSGHLHLNHVLRSIAKTSSGSYLLTFQNGERSTCDRLVLTMPCSVYQDIEFEEGIIPEEQLCHIKGVQYGTNAKILFPIVPSKHSGAQSNGRVVTFPNGDGHVLNVYYTDYYGAFTAASLEKTFEQDLPFIQRLYCSTSALLPVLARDEPFVSYSGAAAHSWLMDPFSKGSYSCVAPGQEELFTSLEQVQGEWVKTLFAPINNTLFFAGEHTSILLDVGGTMEAAVESGERTARLVLKNLPAPS